MAPREPSPFDRVVLAVVVLLLTAAVLWQRTDALGATAFLEAARRFMR